MRSRQQRKKPPHSVQETIPYERMWPDGICRVSPSYYTKTVQFWDINYQLAQNEDKSAIFEGWCDFLNAFDSSVHLQLSFLNLTANADAVEQRILLPDKADGFDAIRREYTEMLQNQLAGAISQLDGTVADNLASQAVLLVSLEYEAQGIAHDVQIAYLLRIGGQMLGLTLLMVAAAVAVGFIASRVSAAIGRDLRRETFSGTCARSFYVGDAVKKEDIHAKFEDGILHVTLPAPQQQKALPVNPNLIEIE